MRSKDPLWPAGHLPHKGGETQPHLLFFKLGRCGKLSPSPLWGGVLSRYNSAPSSLEPPHW